MFTIEVVKKGKDEEFGFGDLELFHQECRGGEVKCQDDITNQTFRCERCGEVVRTSKTGTKLEIVLTAIDGKERQLKHLFSDDIRVIQRT